MRYLSKTESSRVLAEGWQYARATDRPHIREALLTEQSRFCAYSERFIETLDAVDIEHFDPRLKDTDKDGYWNWYAVLHWMNQHKPHSIEKFEPLPKPYDLTLPKRLRYVGDIFMPCDEADVEASNLIEFLGWNKPEVVKDRRAHVDRVLDLKKKLDMPLNEFVSWLMTRPKDLSFVTALEVALDCRLVVAEP
jgi:hypothetical protein